MLFVTENDCPSVGEDITAEAAGGSLTLMLTDTFELPPWPSFTLRVMLWSPAGRTDMNLAVVPSAPLTFEDHW